MTKSSATLGALLLLLASTGVGAAEQCRDPNGRFIKCPVVTPTPAARCRDVTSKKFVKCGAPHSEAVPASTGGK
jgi:hypothetical protein